MLPFSILLAFVASGVTAFSDPDFVPTPFSKEFTAPINPPAAYLDSGKRLAVYYGGWSTYNGKTYGNAPTLPYPLENYQPADIPVKLLTDVNYSFYIIANKTEGVMSEVPASKDNFADFNQVFNPTNKENPTIRAVSPDTPDQAYFGNFGQFMKLKKKNQFNFGLALGGFIDSTYFSSAMKTPEFFVDGVMDVLKAYPGLFNHIDIDWEFIQNTETDHFGIGNEASVDDPKNFGRFLRLLRERLDEEGLGNFEISAAVTGNPERMVGLPFKAMINYLDFWNVMTYDFGSSEWFDDENTIGVSSSQTNVYSTDYAPSSVDQAVKAYLGYGVPASKINVGVALYTRLFGNTTGMGKPSNGYGSQSYKDACVNDGTCDYRWLPLKGSTEYWDSKSKATYSLDEKTGDLLTYDSVYSVAEKCKYVWENELSGLFAWEAANDVRDAGSSRSLMAAMNKCLNKDPRLKNKKCNSKRDTKACEFTALATCSNNVWTVKDCGDGLVCQGVGAAAKCGRP
ncbi:glycosyl hydrolases family 18-domain-containing protein [Obelidium mucronatum]|nr:glycosyl hydrolases family 18-domain-containing protein [Obelidium mucronatum]